MNFANNSGEKRADSTERIFVGKIRGKHTTIYMHTLDERIRTIKPYRKIE